MITQISAASEYFNTVFKVLVLIRQPIPYLTHQKVTAISEDSGALT